MALADLWRYRTTFFAFSLYAHYARSIIGSYSSVTVAHFFKTQSFSATLSKLPFGHLKYSWPWKLRLDRLEYLPNVNRKNCSVLFKVFLAQLSNPHLFRRTSCSSSDWKQFDIRQTKNRNSASSTIKAVAFTPGVRLILDPVKIFDSFNHTQTR